MLALRPVTAAFGGSATTRQDAKESERHVTDEKTAKIIDLPERPDNTWWSGRKGCPTCGGDLRPARLAEIEADLLSPDPQIRQLAALSTQGRRDVAVPAELEDPIDRTVSSWQFRCDKCGHRSLRTRTEPIDSRE